MKQICLSEYLPHCASYNCSLRRRVFCPEELMSFCVKICKKRLTIILILLSQLSFSKALNEDIFVDVDTSIVR